MHETTLRVFSALRERTREEGSENYQTLNDIAQDAGLSLDEASTALERLVIVDAVEKTENDEMAYRSRDITVGKIADRLAAVHDLPDDRRNAVLERLRSGDVDPDSLVALVDALGLGKTAEETTNGETGHNQSSADDSTAPTDDRGVFASVSNRLSRFMPGS
ncbi:hypothetical protein [Halospeciosus flavus]|uniref:Uncharacterized protein n=1 Tax=Halospeciosus flavus TaxID=3032283 RepID=A0ABD5Z3A0_9EURY|nr:hypothetical protein [Halospeciosus flavus]